MASIGGWVKGWRGGMVVREQMVDEAGVEYVRWGDRRNRDALSGFPGRARVTGDKGWEEQGGDAKGVGTA